MKGKQARRGKEEDRESGRMEKGREQEEGGWGTVSTANQRTSEWFKCKPEALLQATCVEVCLEHNNMVSR